MNQRDRATVVIVSVFVVLLVLLLSLRFDTLTSLKGPERIPEKWIEQDYVRIGLIQSIDALNPYVGLNDASRLFYSLVYDCLTTFDHRMSVTGNLAVSFWRVPVTDPAMVASGDPYGSVWEYNLTHNARWHDGVEFTADDVVYNVNLHAQNYDLMWVNQPYTYFIEEAEKVDNYTVRIHFWDRATGEPMPVAWGYFIPIHMLPKHLLEQLPGGPSYLGMNWSGVFPSDVSPGHPIVGTGPWQADETIWSNWTQCSVITLSRNPNYHWKLDKPGYPQVRLDNLIMRFFTSPTDMALALKSLEIDVAKFPPDEYEPISDEVSSDIHSNFTCFSGQSGAQGFVYLSFWMTTAGGDNDARLDPDVRRAMALAVNRTWIIDNIFHGLADPGSTVIPSINPWHYDPSAAEQITYNLTAASQLLESSGYVDVDDDGIRECTLASKAVEMGWADEGVELELRVPVFESRYFDSYVMGQFLETEFEKIGINITLLAMSEIIVPLHYYCPIQEDFSISFWPRLDVDPEYVLFTQSYAGLDGWSDTGFSNVSYDENFSLSVSTPDFYPRKPYVDTCQRILYDQCPYIVLAYPYSNYVWSEEGISGWGDWAMDPGKSLDACWGANPLFFDLSPVIREGPDI